MKRHRGSDDGQIALLLIFFGLVILALVTVIVDVTAVFLARRALQATADGASLAAAQRISVPSAYGDEFTSWLPLGSHDAEDTVASYLAQPARIPRSCRAGSLHVDQVVLDAAGQTVMVDLSCSVTLPIVNVVASAWSDGVRIRQHASARTHVAP